MPVTRRHAPIEIRTDCLFSLIDALRRRRPVAASILAKELSVSVRTIYRDIAMLSGRAGNCDDTLLNSLRDYPLKAIKGI